MEFSEFITKHILLLSISTVGSSYKLTPLRWHLPISFGNWPLHRMALGQAKGLGVRGHSFTGWNVSEQRRGDYGVI